MALKGGYFLSLRLIFPQARFPFSWNFQRRSSAVVSGVEEHLWYIRDQWKHAIGLFVSSQLLLVDRDHKTITRRELPNVLRVRSGPSPLGLLEGFFLLLVNLDLHPGRSASLAVTAGVAASVGAKKCPEEARLSACLALGLIAEQITPAYAPQQKVARAIRRIIRFYELTEQPEQADEWRLISERGKEQRI